MKFLVALALDIPAGTPKSEISNRENAEAVAAAKLADTAILSVSGGRPLRMMSLNASRGVTTTRIQSANGRAPSSGLLRRLTQPPRHAHFRSTDHPVIQSYEPGEDWWYCYLDDLVFQNDGAPSFEYS